MAIYGFFKQRLVHVLSLQLGRHCKVRESGLADGAKNSGNELDKDTDDMEYNEAYVQFQIPTKENICYGLIQNQDDLCDTIDISGAAHVNVSIRNETNIYSSIV